MKFLYLVYQSREVLLEAGCEPKNTEQKIQTKTSVILHRGSVIIYRFGIEIENA
jgi:hypothetical protein